MYIILNIHLLDIHLCAMNIHWHNDTYRYFVSEKQQSVHTTQCVIREMINEYTLRTVFSTLLYFIEFSSDYFNSICIMHSYKNI